MAAPTLKGLIARIRALEKAAVRLLGKSKAEAKGKTKTSAKCWSHGPRAQALAERSVNTAELEAIANPQVLRERRGKREGPRPSVWKARTKAPRQSEPPEPERSSRQPSARSSRLSRGALRYLLAACQRLELAARQQRQVAVVLLADHEARRQVGHALVEQLAEHPGLRR